MSRKIGLYILILLFVHTTLLYGQQDDGQSEYDAYTIVVHGRLQQFHDELQDLAGNIATASPAGIHDLQHQFNSLTVRWNTYYAAEQGYIADDEAMMGIVAQYQQLSQVVSDSIDHCRTRLQAVDDFNGVIKFLQSKSADYDRIQKQCDQLSLTDKTKDQLERAKNSEQLLFADITAKYQQAKADIEANPSLAKQETELDNLYLDLSTRSEKVQATVYESFIDRAKNYLLGIAAVAIVLMFISMVVNKIQAFKQMRESMKKLKEQYIKEGQDDIPSI